MIPESRANPRIHERSVEYHRHVGSSGEERGRLCFDDVVIDRRAMLVTRGGARVELEPKAFDVLLHLALRSGQLVTKTDLIADVWKGVAVTDHVLTRVVGQLRRGLGDAAKEARYIETVPTRGYRFIADVRDSPSTDADANDPPAARLPDLPHAPTARPLQSWRWPAALAGLAVVMVVTGAGAWLWARQKPVDGDWSVAPGFARQLTFTSGTLDAHPDFSPDGRMLAYSSSASGAFEIEVRALTAGARPFRVTQDRGGNLQPDWSPDGQYLAYHSMANGGVWVIPALGGVPRRIAAVGAGPAWSPDGRDIVYQTGQPSTVEAGGTPPPSQLLIMSASGGAARPLTRPGHPTGGHTEASWSPDGRRLTFLVRGVVRNEIWTVGRDGGEPQFVWACTGVCSRAAYEPSGEALIVSVRGRGYLRLPIDPTTGAAVGSPIVLVAQHADFPGHLAISPDGRSAVFTELRVSSNLYRLDLDANGRAVGAARALTNETGRTMTPMIAPDGQRVAFAARRESTQICLVGIDGGEVTPLPVPNGFSLVLRPGWAGRQVLGIAADHERSAVVSIDPDSRETRTLASLGASTVSGNAQFLGGGFFHDGRRIAFGRETAEGVGIYTMDFVTKAEKRITPAGENATFPSPSPDGRFIAYERVADGSMYPMVVSSEGGATRQLLAERGLTWPHSWSADGRRLLAALRRGTIWSLASLSVETGQATVLFTEPAPHAYLRYPSISPAGDRVVYERTEITGNIWQIALRPDRRDGTR
jgi:Tol biopolymer transport system component/DNA-binding winged helix-turn-helix (wHTH) protein